MIDVTKINHVDFTRLQIPQETAVYISVIEQMTFNCMQTI